MMETFQIAGTSLTVDARGDYSRFSEPVTFREDLPARK